MNNTVTKTVIFENEFEWDRKLVSDTVRFAPDGSFRFTRVLNVVATVAAAVSAVLCVILTAMNDNRYGDSLDTALRLPLLIVLAFAGVMRFPSVQTAIQYKRIKKRTGGAPLFSHCTFDEDTATVRYSDGKSFAVMYSNVTGVAEDSANYYVTVGGISVLPVPKASFLFGDPSYFPVFIRANMSGVRARNTIRALNILLNVLALFFSFITVAAFIGAVVSRSPSSMPEGVALFARFFTK